MKPDLKPPRIAGAFLLAELDLLKERLIARRPPCPHDPKVGSSNLRHPFDRGHTLRKMGRGAFY